MSSSGQNYGPHYYGTDPCGSLELWGPVKNDSHLYSPTSLSVHRTPVALLYSQSCLSTILIVMGGPQEHEQTMDMHAQGPPSPLKAPQLYSGSRLSSFYLANDDAERSVDCHGRGRWGSGTATPGSPALFQVYTTLLLVRELLTLTFPCLCHRCLQGDENHLQPRN